MSSSSKLAGGIGRLIAATLMALSSFSAFAGAQVYEPLSDAVRSALSRTIADGRPARVRYDRIEDRLAYLDWLATMSTRMERREKDYRARKDLLETIYYEAKRAGLDPAMVLGLIQVESGFHKYAVSSAGARGLTQVMPFWVDLIGDHDRSKLFDMRVNVRFGCVILRHYLDIEHGDVFRALGRYNGSLGKPQYPNMVLGAWKHWQYEPQTAPSVPTVPVTAPVIGSGRSASASRY